MSLEKAKLLIPFDLLFCVFEFNKTLHKKQIGSPIKFGIFSMAFRVSVEMCTYGAESSSSVALPISCALQ